MTRSRPMQARTGAGAMPRNNIRVQISPLNFTFETVTAGERMNTIMSHELVHVIAMEQASGRDRVFRKLFFGKVLPLAEQPESVLFFYLTAPRVSAPRWFHEGVAVFIDTWENGGTGRAQGGYDEMVFRAMVKDGVIAVDVGINPVKDEGTGKVRLVGDLDFESVAERAEPVTPVPGGVGPITDVWLLRNTAEAAALQS